MQHYQVTLIKDRASASAGNLIQTIQTEFTSNLSQQNIVVYGIFSGLFGLASNEVYLVVNSPASISDYSELITSAGFSIIDQIDLSPTVRPTEHTPRTRSGIYVFRWFTITNKHIDKIVALSNQAWLTFEGGFDTEVQCLFAQPEHHMRASDETGKMLLITWYKDLHTWQQSRTPPPEARENFQQRHALTLEAKPIATRLV